MNEQQQKILEEVLLDSIRSSLHKNNNSYLSLITIAKEKNIFFPELYLAFFSQALHQSFNSEYFHVIENYDSFGISITEAGRLYYETWLYEVEDFINLHLKNQTATKEEAHVILFEKFQHALKLGIPLPEEFNNNKYINSIMGEENFKALKRMNKNNITKNLKYTQIGRDTTIDSQVNTLVDNNINSDHNE